MMNERALCGLVGIDRRTGSEASCQMLAGHPGFHRALSGDWVMACPCGKDLAHEGACKAAPPAPRADEPTVQAEVEPVIFDEPISDAIKQKWVEFHSENPQVYEKLVKYAREIKAAGRTKIGIALIWERMRWDFWISTSGEVFKLNNNHRALYARYIMARHPDLRDIFEIRHRRPLRESA